MARSELQKVNGKRMRFTARVERFGRKPAYRGPDLITLLLTDVRFEDGSLATDHLWFTSGIWSEGLDIGMRFAFDARVDSYDAGYRGAKAEGLGMDSYRTDYHLERPTKVEVLEMTPEQMTKFLTQNPGWTKPDSANELGEALERHRLSMLSSPAWRNLDPTVATGFGR